LKLSFEQLALIVVLVGLPRRRLDAGKQRGLQAGVLAVEAVLTEQGQVANALGVAAVEGLRHLVMRRATLGMSVRGLAMVARLADAGSHHIRQLDGDHHPVGQAVRIAKRRAFERGKAVRVLVFRRGSLQHGIAELVE
jgi:hypothetical protein